ncbi:MAG: FAD-dependent oxidoreductase [Candidatus Odinarchaeota archaeon]
MSEPNSKVLIIGGGIAGISAALDLAEQGFKVQIIEKSPAIGGKMGQLDKTFPTMDCSSCILTPKTSDIAWHENIELYAYSELEKLEGEPGVFTATVRVKGRGVIMDKCNGCGDCAPVCPVEVPDEFNQGLSARKAIYIPSPQSIPNRYTIDFDHCIRCHKCKVACKPEAIDFEDAAKDKYIKLSTNAVIITSGYSVYNPQRDPVYKYGQLNNVLTTLDMERLLSASGPTMGKVVKRNGQKPKAIAFVQCIGSRDVNRNAYCSRICCMASLKQARMIKEKYDAEVFLLYMDIRAFGKGYEEFYRSTQEAYGVKFLRGRVAEVSGTDSEEFYQVKVEDTISGKLLEMNFDMIVLSVGLQARTDAVSLAETLGIDLGEDGFFVEKNLKTGTVLSLKEGIYVAGVAQGPKDIPDTVSQAKAAASEAASFLLSKSVVTKKKSAVSKVN